MKMVIESSTWQTVGSYICAMEFNHGPSIFAFSRQNLPQLARSSPESVAMGGYVVHESKAGSVVFIFIC